MTLHDHSNPASCAVERLCDTGERVATLGTDCLETGDAYPRDLDLMAEEAGASISNDCGAMYRLADDDGALAGRLRAEGYSPRFIAICEHFRHQGFDYLWFDCDRTTPMASGPDCVRPPAPPQIITVSDVEGEMSVDDVPPGMVVRCESLDRNIVGAEAQDYESKGSGYLDADGDFWWRQEFVGPPAGPSPAAAPSCPSLLSARELAHVLAALRYVQHAAHHLPRGSADPPLCWEDTPQAVLFESSGVAPLDSLQIDELCERLNGAAAPKEALAP
jgi:hypothetical protein